MRIALLIAVMTAAALPAAAQYGYDDPYASPYNPGYGSGPAATAIAPSTIPGQHGAGVAVPQTPPAPRSQRPPAQTQNQMQTQGSIGWGQPDSQWPAPSPAYPSSVYPSSYPDDLAYPEPAYTNEAASAGNGTPPPALPASPVTGSRPESAIERRASAPDRLRRARVLP